MADLMARIHQHYNTSRQTLHGPIDVPEWGEGDKPLQIYFRNISLSEQESIHKYNQEGSLKALVETLIQRACDAEGNKLFKPVHMTELMKMADADVISNIFIEMSNVESEEPEKN